MSFNKIIIVGYLGRDPELRFTSQNTPVCTFSVATTEGKKDDPKGEITTWFRVTFWREKAELANKYLEKGKQVYVEGRLKSREWQDRDGVMRTSLEVTGTELHFIDSKPADAGDRPNGKDLRTGAAAARSGKPNGERSSGNDAPPEEELSEDDIPF